MRPYLAAARAQPDSYPDVLTAHCLGLIATGRANDAAELLWPLTAKSPRWRATWMQMAAQSPDKQNALAWLDRIMPIISADAIEERVALAEAYDFVGQKAKDNEPVKKELEKKASDQFAEIAEHPKVTAMALLAAAGRAERLEDWALAEKLYRRTLEKAADSLIAMNNLAMILARNGNAKEAVTLATGALKLAPRQPAVLDTLAFAQSKAADYKAAAESLRAAIRLDPDNPKWRVRWRNISSTAAMWSGRARPSTRLPEPSTRWCGRILKSSPRP